MLNIVIIKKNNKVLKDKIKILLREHLKNISNFEYQIRDIDGPVYYRRKKGEKNNRHGVR